LLQKHSINGYLIPISFKCLKKKIFFDLMFENITKFFKVSLHKTKKMHLYSRAIVIFSKNVVSMFVSCIVFFFCQAIIKWYTIFILPCHPLNMSFKKYPVRKVRMQENILIISNLCQTYQLEPKHEKIKPKNVLIVSKVHFFYENSAQLFHQISFHSVE